MKYLEIINRGGPFMYPILIVSIFALSIMAERIYYLFVRLHLNVREFSRKIFHAVEGGGVNRAISYCHQFSYHPLCRVLNAALLKANRGDKEVERAMEGAFLEVSPTVQQRTGYLSLLANVATLMGLLGTIFGLIQAFKGVTLADAAMKQEMLAKGIAVAMSTTAFGLIVAIPCLIAYHILTNRQNHILDTIQESGTQLLNLISASNRDLRAGPSRVEELGQSRRR